MLPRLVVCSLFVAANLSAADLDVKEYVNALGMKLIRVEPGEFTMGHGEKGPTSKEEWERRDEDESPAHRVRISQAFYLGAHEVTNAQFRALFPDDKSDHNRDGRRDNEPVSQVTWKQAVDFCRRLSEKDGRPYRLPTEAEWEYVCRCGGAASDDLSPEKVNLGIDRDGKKRIEVRPVGAYPPNAWGFFDLQGNVAEWCADWYGPYTADEQTDPVGRAAGVARVTRGWSWLQPSYQAAARFARATNRSGHLPDDANKFTGFRVVLGEPPATKPLAVAEPPLFQREVRQTPAPKKQPSAEPTFVNFEKGNRNPSIPPNTFGPIFSQHNHFSAACVCPNGDVLAVWYTCVGESDRQLAQACSRLRVGAEAWEPASLFFGVPDVNCHAPVLLTVGERIYHFCTQSLRGWDDATNIVRWSDDNGATWSAPQIVLSRNDPGKLSQPCSAVATSDGAILLACDGDNHRDAYIVVGTNHGRDWRVAKGDMKKSAGGKNVLHPAITLRGDGGVLCFLRGVDPMPLLVSEDRGDSWTETTAAFDGITVGNKCAALRLASGAIVVLTLDSKKRFGGGAYIALSTDDGRTWPHARKVEGVGGYTSLAQAQDGMIYLIGSRMKFAACNEAWIREGKELPPRPEKTSGD